MPTLNRLQFLDSLRGWAAVYVLAYHVALIPTPTIDPPGPLNFAVWFGGTGVALFFVISGFSLSMTMGRHQHTQAPLLSYAVSRLFRIAPLFYAVVAISCLRDFLLFNHAPRLKALALNLTFLFNFRSEHQGSLVWAGWTIGVEMLFYAAFPWIWRLRLRWRVAVFLLSLAAFVPTIGSHYPSYGFFTIAGHFPVFMMGMFAYDLYIHLHSKDRAEAAGVVLSGVGFGMLLACAAQEHANMNVQMRLPIGLAYSLLLVGCGLKFWPLIVNRVSAFYGQISYSLYLLHPLLVYALQPVYRDVVSRLGAIPGYALCVAFTLAIMTVLAWIFYRLVERPGIKAGHRVFEVISPVYARLLDRSRVRPPQL